MKNDQLTALDQTRTFTRNLDISDSQTRNVSITLRPTNDEQFPFEIVQIHECWTGREWLPITNKEDGWNFADAVRKAREMVDAFMEDSFLMAEVDSQCC